MVQRARREPLPPRRGGGADLDGFIEAGDFLSTRAGEASSAISSVHWGSLSLQRKRPRSVYSRRWRQLDSSRGMQIVTSEIEIWTGKGHLARVGLAPPKSALCGLNSAALAAR